MGDNAQPTGRTAADDILDYALGTSLLATLAVTTFLISTGTPITLTVIGMATIGGIWTFTIVPHLVAYWLNTPIDTLLNINHSEPTELHTETHQNTSSKANNSHNNTNTNP